MRTNEFKPVATGPGANIQAQSDFNIDGILVSGVEAGVALSAKANKMWRQSSFVISAIAQFISDTQDVDVLDDEDMAGFIAKYKAALATWITTGVLFQSFLQEDATFWVGGIGANDANDGSEAHPWATFQKVVTTLKSINNNGHTIEVNCAGAFDQGIFITGPFAGGGLVVFNFASGSSITKASGVGACINLDAGASINVMGPVTLSNTSISSTSGSDGCGIFCSRGASLALSAGTIYGNCTKQQVVAVSSAVITIDGNYIISGNAVNHIVQGESSLVALSNNGLAMVVTLIGTPSFSNSFVNLVNLAVLSAPSGRVTYTGSAIGQRYLVAANSIINTEGGGDTFLPGSSAGADSTGGQYL